MDFALSSDQQALAGLAGQIFGDRATPERVEAVLATAERFDRPLWGELLDAGLVGIALPEHAGGAGLGLVELAIVAEAQGRTVAPVPLVWTATAAMAVAQFGTAQLCETWLPGVLRGEIILTSAPPVAAGHLRLDPAGTTVTGAITAVPFGHVATAVLVGIGDALYVLDPHDEHVVARPGEATNHEIHTELLCQAAPVTRLGGPGAAAWLWERTTVALAAVQAGVTAGALALTARYTSERMQFDKPLSSFQGVALKAADGYVDNAGIRAACLQAAWLIDRGDDAAAQVLTAAWWAADAGQHCVHITQHLHGGMGADITYPVHRFFLWGKQIELMLGGASAILLALSDALETLDRPGDEIVIRGHEALSGH